MLCDSKKAKTDEKTIIQKDGIKFIKRESKRGQEKITMYNIKMIVRIITKIIIIVALIT